MTAPLELRPPAPTDGRPVAGLVADTGVLDVNSDYAYCATFKHFSATSVVAAADDVVGGFVTAYRPPDRPDVLFVWQVGVDERYRGQGLATRMLQWILDQPACRNVQWLETTVTPSNQPSRARFQRLSQRLGTACQVGPGFGPAELGPDHEPEELFRIGPIRTEPS